MNPAASPLRPIWISSDKTRMVVLAEVVHFEYKARGHYAGEGRWQDYLILMLRSADDPVTLYGYDATDAHRALVQYYEAQQP